MNIRIHVFFLFISFITITIFTLNFQLLHAMSYMVAGKTHWYPRLAICSCVKE